jgi:hypothetical protein
LLYFRLRHSNAYEQGIGHVGRTIAVTFDAEPDNAFTAGELCARVYAMLRARAASARAKRVAVLRAVKSLAVHRPDLDVRRAARPPFFTGEAGSWPTPWRG